MTQESDIDYLAIAQKATRERGRPYLNNLVAPLNDEDFVLISAGVLERFCGIVFGKKMPFLSLYYWKRDYGFPMRKEGGFPTLHLCEFITWIGLHDHGNGPQSISTETLKRDDLMSRLNALSNTELDGLRGIADFINKEMESVYLWPKNWIGCPIYRNPQGQWRVGRRDLLLWMNTVGINFPISCLDPSDMRSVFVNPFERDNKESEAGHEDRCSD
ncbi:MAG: hypothetical protein JW943_04645 [Deltaproteobacteria bacterium]|nr:hypothetical protein [Deltaproteobacteria bacterium]